MKVHHISLVISDLKTSANFYSNILGLSIDKRRPNLSFDGIWYTLGEQQIHLLLVDNPDPVTERPDYPGRDRHLALSCTNLPAIEETLNTCGINYHKSSSGREALFLRDPDGNGLELIQASH